MQQYPLTEIHDRSQEVFTQAQTEPILLLDNNNPSYIIMTTQCYDQLNDRLAMLEDYAFGKLAELNLARSSMVGTERFTAELIRLSQLDPSEA